MLTIHKGNKYTIISDGINARKTDGTDTRTMKYYPERDIAALAGEIDELTAWRIFYDVAKNAELASPISPDHIFIDGDGFVLSGWSGGKDKRFLAPEGYCPVWALGATVFFVYLGCHVFQGLGGAGQTATAPVPTLRRELPELSALIVKCLAFNPVARPKMSEIERIARENMKRCETIRIDLPPIKKIPGNNIAPDEIDVYWPEEMY